MSGPVDTSKLVDGDRVAIWLTVEEIGSGLPGRIGRTRLAEFEIAKIEPRPLAVGDRVRETSTTRTAEVLALHKDRAWVLDDVVGNARTALLAELERLP